MPEKVYRAQFILGVGPIGAEPKRKMRRQEWWTQEMTKRGILTTSVNIDALTQDIGEDIKVLHSIQATSADAIRWYVREHVGLTAEDPALEEVERQLHRVHDFEPD